MKKNDGWGILRIRWTFGILILLMAGLASGQDRPQTDSVIFGDSVDVRIVNLEVVASRGGERLRGLGPEHFRLLVNGREVPIEFFSEVEDGRAIASTSADVEPMTRLEPGERVGTRYLIFVDDFFTLPAYRNRVLRQLQKESALLSPEDSLAIVAYDGRRIDMLTSWTNSARDIERALREAEDRPAFGLQRLSEQRRFGSYRRFGGAGSSFAGVGFSGSAFNRSAFRAEDTFRAREVAQQVENVVLAATSTMRAFAMPSGRKVMLLLSGGWPITGVNWLAGPDAPGELYSGLSYAERSLTQLIDTANRVGYTLYPVDVPGVQRQRGIDASVRSVREAEFRDAVRFGRELNEEQTLLYLAENTGGKAFLDGSSLRALSATAEDTQTYYWLAFTPDWQQNDERYKVKVELVGAKGKVRSRKSFSDLSQQTETTMQVESALLFDAPLGDGELTLRVGEAQGGGLGKLLLPVELEIPVDQVTLLPTAEGFTGRFELRVAVISERGDRADIPVIPVVVTSREEPAAGTTVRYETTLKVRKQRQEFLLTLTDPITGQSLSARYQHNP